MTEPQAITFPILGDSLTSTSLYYLLTTGLLGPQAFYTLPFNFFQTTVASKFLLLQESVHDAADLYLSLKYPPVVLVNDTPCGFARHLDLREPTLLQNLAPSTGPKKDSLKTIPTL